MSKGKPGSTATSYAGRMAKFDDKDLNNLISSYYIYESFSDKTQMISEEITKPENAYFMLKSKDFEGKFENKSKYYSVPFERTSM